MKIDTRALTSPENFHVRSYRILARFERVSLQRHFGIAPFRGNHLEISVLRTRYGANLEYLGVLHMWYTWYYLQASRLLLFALLGRKLGVLLVALVNEPLWIGDVSVRCLAVSRELL